MVKRTHAFFITVAVGELYEEVRSDLLSILEAFDCVKEYCIAVENYHCNKGTFHIHCYVQFGNGVLLSDLQAFLRDFTSGSLNIQSCKSRKSVLKYITKEDASPLFNCSESCLSFTYRARAWATRTRTFSFKDPFVLEHPNYYRILQSLHSEVRETRGRVQLHFKAPNAWYTGWCMRVLDYFAHAFRVPRQDSRALYLHGLAGAGKSRAVEELLECVRSQDDMVSASDRVYAPVPGQFFFGDYHAGDYSVILFEEFQEDQFKRNWWQIKRVMEGKSFKCDVKHGSSVFRRCRAPVIFVSNEYPPQDPAFLRRVVIVDADEKVYDRPKAVVPKEEVEEVQEVIEVSSSEEDVSLPEANVPTESIQA